MEYKKDSLPHMAPRWNGKTDRNCLVVTGIMEFYDFPFRWECHHPNWLELHHFTEGWLNSKPPTRKAKLLDSDFHCFSIWKRGRGSDCTALAPSPQVSRGFFMLFPDPSPDSGGESNFGSSSLGYHQMGRSAGQRWHVLGLGWHSLESDVFWLWNPQSSMILRKFICTARRLQVGIAHS